MIKEMVDNLPTSSSSTSLLMIYSYVSHLACLLVCKAQHQPKHGFMSAISRTALILLTVITSMSFELQSIKSILTGRDCERI